MPAAPGAHTGQVPRLPVQITLFLNAATRAKVAREMTHDADPPPTPARKDESVAGEKPAGPERRVRTVAELTEESRKLEQLAADLIEQMKALAGEVAELRAERANGQGKQKR